jgi:hypothetical protein
MKNILFLYAISFLVFSANASDSRWFSQGSMRVDFIMGGDKTQTSVYLTKIMRTPFWGGSDINHIDLFDYGNFKFQIIDSIEKDILFVKGFSNLFMEWQTTGEASTLNRAFSNTLHFPHPKNPVIFELYKRKADQSWEKIFDVDINPKDALIEEFKAEKMEISEIMVNGSTESMVDIAILAEGYTLDEMEMFKNDARELIDNLFTVEPFAAYKNKFNIRLVHSPSEESGTDIPAEGVWKNTSFNSGFSTFGIERYLTSPDYSEICNKADCVPWDQIVVLVNTERYGGGGIYNFYSITSSRHPLSKGVFVHEFAHAFAGLADEYYTSDVSYEGFYNLNYEPWEPNITTLVNFKSKWAKHVSAGLPVPTPNTPEYSNKIGVFEGAGYVPKGIFRPYHDCIMKSNSRKDFCPVCTMAIEKMINFTSK